MRGRTHLRPEPLLRCLNKLPSRGMLRRIKGRYIHRPNLRGGIKIGHDRSDLCLDAARDVFVMKSWAWNGRRRENMREIPLGRSLAFF
jgi:hypothetical protein